MAAAARCGGSQEPAAAARRDCCLQSLAVLAAACPTQHTAVSTSPARLLELRREGEAARAVLLAAAGDAPRRQQVARELRRMPSTTVRSLGVPGQCFLRDALGALGDAEGFHASRLALAASDPAMAHPERWCDWANMGAEMLEDGFVRNATEALARAQELLGRMRCAPEEAAARGAEIAQLRSLALRRLGRSVDAAAVERGGGGPQAP
eukprot:TRINITY_DN27810_c0_g1_i1.p2 TRINITY_DN27810_c0_g1~~TRINITY_DN27810_c0_g1_i1.p2  ORF type:complete len:237 (+),score=82.06 TRINITY_DN27810_c0_g1_i1:89-712(+)